MVFIIGVEDFERLLAAERSRCEVPSYALRSDNSQLL